ncbi:hypothetical protein [Mesorhizobium sp. IMUNJ 23232]|uniref:hypothetical protein n=1 Tax=Mesorhizobium sp. IMUNJ 23232 TaxID=3376064 RepID=UPI0037A5CF3F
MTQSRNDDLSGRHGRAIEELGKLWDEGIASGPSEDGEEVFKELRRELAEIFAPRDGS